MVEDVSDSQVTGKLTILSCEVSVPLAAACSLAPCPLQPSSQSLSLGHPHKSLLPMDFLYCSISSALVTFSSGQEKFLIQAADEELQLTFSGLVSSQVVADIPVSR